MYLGDFKEDGDLFFKFTTRAFATGIPTTLSGSPVLSVYKDEGGAATEKTTAETYFDLDVDHDSIAGWNNVRIDLSGDAFFATGADYSVVITTGTVDSVNVFGENLANFSIENRSMGQPVGATLSDDIAAIKAETALIVEDTGTTLPDTLGGLGGATGGSVSIETLLDNTLTGTSINNGGAAVDKSTSPATVGIPVTSHGFVAGQQVTLANTASNDGSFDVDSVSTNEVVILKTFAAETFGADDTISSTVKTVGFVGSVQAGTVVSTEALGGAIHDIDDTGNDIDMIYTFNVGAGREGTEIIFHGFVQGNADTIDIEVYDHIGTDWEILRTITGQNGTTNITLEVPLLLKHTGTSGLDTGRIYVRFDTNATTPSNLTIDQILVEAINTGSLSAYENGQIWLDTNASNTNTVADVDGTTRRPVSTIAAAKTLSTTTGLGDFHVINGSSFTLAENSDNESYFGDNWTLALGGQSCAGAHFEGAEVTGTQTGSGCGFHGGEMGTSTLADDAHLDEVGLSGTITLAAGATEFFNCHHDGASLPVLDLTTGNTTVHMHSYHGGLEIQNADSSDTLHLDGNGRLDINANCLGLVVNVRGNWDINDSGSSTITRDDITLDAAATLVDTAEIQGKLPTNKFMGSSDGADDDGTLNTISTNVSAIPTTAMRGTDNAALASVLGALNDAAAADEVTTADTLVQYTKQLINILVGTPGVVTLKAAAAPASGVSLSEMIRAIYDDTNSLDGTKIPDTISLANINAEADTALDTTIAELSQGVPATNPTMRTAIMLQYMALRNKLDVATSGTDTLEIHNNAGTRIAQKLLTDDGADYSEAKMTSGA